MKFYLDDVRKCPSGWIPVRKALDMIQLLEEQEVEEISLDHDLGSCEPTGMAVLNWIEKQFYTNPDFVLPKIYLHTMNPVGRKEMKQVIDKLERENKDGKNNKKTS